jgi:hypothetical protein
MAGSMLRFHELQTSILMWGESDGVSHFARPVEAETDPDRLHADSKQLTAA